MSELNIVQTGFPILREQARPLSKEEILSPFIQKLIVQMKNSMDAAPGVGLAAPQIGESLQIAVIEDKSSFLAGLPVALLKERERKPVAFHVIINPVLTVLGTDTREFYEGCLSIDGFMGCVQRALSVQVECLNEKAEAVTIHAFGWYARILQHEIDHLNGVLYIDRMRTQTFTTVENYQKFVLT